LIAKVKTSGESDYDKVIETAEKAFKEFRLIPAPKRGNCKTAGSKIKTVQRRSWKTGFL
jgi:aldehyde dehydrogenase (NAD+)